MTATRRRIAPTLAPAPSRTRVAIVYPCSGWPAWLGALLATFFCAPPAGADPARPSVGSACPQEQRNALDELACELAATLNRTATGAPRLVIAAAPGAPFENRGARALVERLTRLTAARLGSGARAHAQPVTLPRARALAAPVGRFVHIEPVLRAGRLEATADEYRAGGNIWRRAFDPEPKVLAHAFASRRADAEVRSLLPVTPLVVSRIDRVPAPEREVVALACGDIDADGNDEIVYVGRRRIAVGRFRGTTFTSISAVDWAALSPIAPSPLREPLAGVSFVSGRDILVGSSDRAYTVRLTPSLELIGRLPPVLPWPSGGCSPIGEVGVAGTIDGCRPGDSAPRPELPERIDALASFRFVDREGRLHAVFAARAQGDSRVVLRDEARREAELDALGAQLAWGDLDGDAVPELVAGSDTLEPEQDRLRVLSWHSNEPPAQRVEIPVPDGVTAVAVCPWQGSGLAPVVVASRKELWVIR